MLARIYQSVSAVCPILGLSVGAPGEPSSVRIDFHDEATEEQRTVAQSIVAAFDWSMQAQASWEQQQNRLGAVALMTDGGSVPRAVRASDVVSYQLRNNVAEVLGVLIDHVDELAAMPSASRRAAILGWIAADRTAWEQAGGVWAEPPPEPAEVYDTGTDRVQRDELVPLVGAAIFGE
jgi:hypothetical protein